MRTPRTARFVAALAAVAALSGGVGTAAAVVAPQRAVLPAETTDDVASWALAPAGSTDGSRASDRPDLSYFSTQGAVIDDAVTLYNLGSVQMTFSVYATDAFNDESGQFQLLGGGEQPTGVGSWVTLAQDLITVPAGMQATIPISIAVPANADPGDYAGGIVASVSTAGAGEQGKAITVERRTGTRIYARVGGDLLPELAISGVTTDYDESVDPFDGAAKVTFDVENRGNTRLSGSPMVTMSGPFGMGSQTVTLAAVPELLPGERITVSATVEGVPALMKLDTEVRIMPEGIPGDAEAYEVKGSDSTFTPPMFTMVILLLLVLGVLAFRVVRRRRMPDPTEVLVEDEVKELELV